MAHGETARADEISESQFSVNSFKVADIEVHGSTVLGTQQERMSPMHAVLPWVYCTEQRTAWSVTSVGLHEQCHPDPKAQHIPSGLAKSQEFLSCGYFGGEGPVTGRFGAGMGRMQPLPVSVYPTHPPTELLELATGCSHADRDVMRLRERRTSGSPQVSLWVNEPTALWGSGRAHGLLSD